MHGLWVVFEGRVRVLPILGDEQMIMDSVRVSLSIFAGFTTLSSTVSGAPEIKPAIAFCRLLRRSQSRTFEWILSFDARTLYDLISEPKTTKNDKSKIENNRKLNTDMNDNKTIW